MTGTRRQTERQTDTRLGRYRKRRRQAIRVRSQVRYDDRLCRDMIRLAFKSPTTKRAGLYRASEEHSTVDQYACLVLVMPRRAHCVSTTNNHRLFASAHVVAALCIQRHCCTNHLFIHGVHAVTSLFLPYLWSKHYDAMLWV